MSEHHGEHAAHHVHHHVSPVSQYWLIWIGLMILTAITVLAYYIPIWLNLSLGAGNIVIAMVIATTKATLVALYFMHLKYDKKFNLLAFLSSLIFLGLFLTFTLLDINTRHDSLPFKPAPIYIGKELPMEGEGEAKPGETKAEPKAEGKAAEAAVPAGEAAKPAESGKPAEKAGETPAAKPAAGSSVKTEAKPAPKTEKAPVEKKAAAKAN